MLEKEYDDVWLDGFVKAHARLLQRLHELQCYPARAYYLPRHFRLLKLLRGRGGKGAIASWHRTRHAIAHKINLPVMKLLSLLQHFNHKFVSLLRSARL